MPAFGYIAHIVTEYANSDRDLWSAGGRAASLNAVLYGSIYGEKVLPRLIWGRRVLLDGKFGREVCRR